MIGIGIGSVELTLVGLDHLPVWTPLVQGVAVPSCTEDKSLQSDYGG